MPQEACVVDLFVETALLLCSCGLADELRLPDCNACLVFDGVSSRYLPSIEQTALPGCKKQQHPVIHSTGCRWVVGVCFREVDIPLFLHGGSST